MSSPSNEPANINEFVLNSRKGIQRDSVRVQTRVRITAGVLSGEIPKYDRKRAPEYILSDEQSPLKPNLQASGRHYFKW